MPSYQHAQVKFFWEKSVADYDLHMKKTGHYKAQKKLLLECLEYFESPIMDCAAGSGFLSGVLLEEGFSVFLNDFAKNMFLSFSYKLRKFKQAVFSNKNILDVKYKNKRFKSVLVVNLFYYFNNKERFVRHIKKNILAKNGNVIIFEEYPFQKPKTKEMRLHRNQLMEIIYPISPKEIKDIFKKVGFDCVYQTKIAIDKKHELFGFVFAPVA